MAVNREGKLRQVMENQGKLIFKDNGDHCFYKSWLIADQNASRNEMAITLECTFWLFSGGGNFLLQIQGPGGQEWGRVWGGFGEGLGRVRASPVFH